MDKSIVISGAGGALGSAVVEEFLNSGDTVHALYHRAPEPSAIAKLNTYTVDLLDENAVDNLAAQILEKDTKINALVCTAGGFAPGNLENTGADDMRKQYEVNFLTAHNLVHPFYTKLKEKGSGKIFLIGSRQGADAKRSINSVAYGLSKSLLFRLAEMINSDSKGKVIATVIAPSTIDTEANRKAMPDANFSDWVSPASIARVIRFYCSGEATDIREPVVNLFGNA